MLLNLKSFSRYAALGLFLLAPTAACAETPMTKAQIVELIKETVRDNPDLIIDALQNHENKAAEAKDAARSEIIAKNQTALYNDGRSLVLGAPEGDVTLVAFKDHRCGYCKKSWKTVKELIAEDKNLRVVMKEYPILGAASVKASQYALASDKQGKYAAYYEALMTYRGPWTVAGLEKLATKTGLDPDKLRLDAESDDVKKALEANRALGVQLEIFGTPAFIIGDRFIEGAAPYDTLKTLIAETRAAKAK